MQQIRTEKLNASAWRLLPVVMLKRWTIWFVSTGTNSIKCLVNWIQVRLRICVRLRSIHPHDGVGYVSKERRLSMESDSQDMSSNAFLWKRTNCLVVIQKWSWRGKFVASAQAWLWEANVERWHFLFPCQFGVCSLCQNVRRIRRFCKHFSSTCKNNAAAECQLPIKKFVWLARHHARVLP